MIYAKHASFMGRYDLRLLVDLRVFRRDEDRCNHPSTSSVYVTCTLVLTNSVRTGSWLL